MVLVVILYLGFLTTFSLLGRDNFVCIFSVLTYPTDLRRESTAADQKMQTLKGMAMYLTKIFYGSSYVGFDIMDKIDPFFGPPLMYAFITLSSFLLMGSLTGESSPPLHAYPLHTPSDRISPGMLSNSFSRVISHAREEYLYVYSVYVLEASTSNRLTHFYPPFNLLALVIFRPLRLFFHSGSRFRAARILLLKATHLPVVGAIMLFELIRGKVTSDEYCGFKGPRHESASGGVSSNGNNKGTPRRKVSRNRMRPASSSSAYAQQQQQARPQSMGMFEPSRLGPGRVGTMSIASLPVDNNYSANDDVDAPTDMEVKIAELHGKIDRLTDIVLSMQREREASHHAEPVT